MQQNYLSSVKLIVFMNTLLLLPKKFGKKPTDAPFASSTVAPIPSPSSIAMQVLYLVQHQLNPLVRLLLQHFQFAPPTY